MDHALARGVMHFDTAANYSAGASERIVGAWLRNREPGTAAPQIATKLYPPYDPASLDRGTAASAERLGVPQIDLLYLHKWDAAVATAATLRALDCLLRSGRIAAAGICNVDAEKLRLILAAGADAGVAPFTYLQNNHNLAVRDVDRQLSELCAAHGISIVTYSPLGAGFLTGKHRGGVQPGSRFDVAPGHQAIYFQPAAEARLARLVELSARLGRPMAHLSLVWALRQPGIAITLVGGRTAAHLDQAFAALAEQDPAVLQAVDSF